MVDVAGLRYKALTISHLQQNMKTEYQAAHKPCDIPCPPLSEATLLTLNRKVTEAKSNEVIPYQVRVIV